MLPRSKPEDTDLCGFRDHLLREEKSPSTLQKYLRDARAFLAFARGRPMDKALVLGWKQSLQTEGRALRSVNSMLASVNSYLRYLGREDCRVKYLRAQREIYSAEDRELSREEYRRLLAAAEKKPRLHLVLQTICATGIRVSELRFFTVEAIHKGEVTVRCKSKSRRILLPRELRRRLLAYAAQREVTSGVILRTSGGKPLDRSNVWAEMKRLCADAKVNPRKVFPHNLRKLFARCFYALDKDIAKLADLLGHSSINTTRIYIMTTAREHLRQLDRLQLLADIKNTT